MKKKYADLNSFIFWKALWITMRPYLLFVSGVAGMAGFVDGAERGIGVTLGVFFCFFPCLWIRAGID